MKRRQLIALVTAASICAPTLLLAGVADSVVRQLQAQGYTSIEVSRTWLGRVQIEAKRGAEEREIVLNRKTGEILRDYSHISSDDDDDDDDDGRGFLLDRDEDDGDGESAGDDDSDDDDDSGDDSGSGHGGDDGGHGDDDDD